MRVQLSNGLHINGRGDLIVTWKRSIPVTDTLPDSPFGLTAMSRWGKSARMWITLYFLSCWSNNKPAWKQSYQRCKAEVIQWLGEMLWQVYPFVELYKRMNEMEKKSSGKNKSPTFFWYDTDHIENKASDNSYIVVCVFITVGMWLLAQYLAMIGGIHKCTKTHKTARWSNKPPFIFSK
jgi:hypothetical protein